MLTEGWDCNTVTHIIGLRPFMSQLLCEQVVGRGLRRRSYELGDDGKFTEEVAKVFGVPFEVIPFKATPQGRAPPTGQAPPRPRRSRRRRSWKSAFRAWRATRKAMRNRVTVDWSSVPRRSSSIRDGFRPKSRSKG